MDVDPNNEGTEDHPDITDPNEPAEASGPAEDVSESENTDTSPEVTEPEVEVEPEPAVDDEFKATAWQMYESLPLKASYRLRWLKDVTGVITKNSIKTDEQWRALMDRSGAVLSGDEEIAAKNRSDTGEQGKMV